MKFIKTNDFRKSVAYKWALYFIIVLIIPILLNFSAYLYSTSRVEENVTQQNLSYYRNFCRSIDSIILNYNKIAMNMSNASSIADMKNPAEPEVFAEIKDMFLMYDADFKDCAYYGIYSAKYNVMTDIYTTNEIENGFGGMTTVVNPEFEEIYTWLTTYYSDNYFFITSDSNKHYILCKYELNNSFVSSYLVVMLDEDFFRKKLIDSPFKNGGTFFVLSENDEVLFKTGNAKLYDKQLKNSAIKDGIFKQNINNEKIVVTCVSSSVTNWKYISFVPNNIYLKSIQSIKYIQIFMIAIAAIIGLILIFFLIRKLYRPIKKLLEMLPEENKNFDEYDRIEHLIKKSIKNQKNTQSIMTEQKKIINDYALVSYLTMNRGEMDVEVLADLQKCLVYKKYFLLMFSLDEYNLLFMEEKNVSEKQKYSLMKTIIINIAGELLSEKPAKHYFFDNNGFLMCILNMSEEATEEKVVETLIKARNYVEEYFIVSFEAAVSTAFYNVEQISSAYLECMNIFEYNKISGSTDILSYDKTICDDSKSFESLKQQELDEICHTILNESSDEAMNKINLILNRKFRNRNFSNAYFKYLLNDISVNIVKIFKKYITDDDIVYSLFQDNINSPDQLGNLLKHISDNITAVNEQSNISVIKKEILVENIKKYLQENYHDPGLNVTQIADKFSYVPSYVSKIFKDQTDTGILEYLVKIRIEHAKKLLENTDMLLQDIAEKVGYYNSAALIRIFKKYEGITPGNYKNKIKY